MKSVKDKLTKELSKKYGVDQRIVRLIADYPIKFFKNVCADPKDIRPVRLRYFGAFVPKTKYIRQFEESIVEEEDEVDLANSLIDMLVSTDQERKE